MTPWKPFILAGSLTLILALLPGCNRDARGSGSQGGEGGGPSSEQRASMADLKRSLDAVDDRLKALGERASGAGDKVKQDVKDEIARLEAVRDKLYGQLQALQSASTEEWEGLKTRTATSVDSLGRVVAKTWRNVAGEEGPAVPEEGE